MADVAIVSVASATAVGTAGIVAGHLTARGHRRHERELREQQWRAERQAVVYDQRRAAYVEALTIAIAFGWRVRVENRIIEDPWRGATEEYLFRSGAAVLAWGSDTVVDLWQRLIGEALADLTDAVPDEVRERVADLVAALRVQINAELRAIAD